LKLVSVVIPTFNAERFISRSLKSILSQTYKNIEVLVIDDCSTDSSVEIVEKFHDKRVRVIKNKFNIGPASSLNVGITESKGDFIAIMHADDISVYNRLEVQVNFFRYNPHIHVLATSYVEIDEHDSIINIKKTKSSKNITERMLLHNVICHPTVMFNRSELSKDLLYYPGMRVNEDYELWKRLLYKKKRFYVLSKTLIFYRIHNKQQSYLQQSREIKSFKKLRREFWEQLEKDTKILDVIENFEGEKFKKLIQSKVSLNKSELKFISGLIHKEVKSGVTDFDFVSYLSIVIRTRFTICDFKTIYFLIKKMWNTF
jgi:glycosyltransferase involved in cell wall biosynthesis